MLLLLLACSADKAADTATPEGPDGFTFSVTAPGPFSVGYRAWPVTYDLPDGSARTVILNLWYPTSDTAGTEGAYTTGGPATGTLWEASLAPPAWGGRHPVVLHSHGHMGWGANSADLARFFASHGWLFVAPDHTGNTLMDNLDPRPLAMYGWRPLDLQAALDAVEADPTVGPTAKTDAVLLSGHSYGGFTVWPAGGAPYDLATIAARCDAGELDLCDADSLDLLAGPLGEDRAVALMPMAGAIDEAWMRWEDRPKVEAPVLFLSGTADDVGQQRQWERIEGVDYRWVDILGGCHQTFGLGTCETLPAEEGFAIVNTYALSWARFAVLGDDNADVVGILDGSVAVSAGTTLQHKGP